MSPHLKYPMIFQVITLFLSPVYGMVLGPWLIERIGATPSFFVVTVLVLWPWAWIMAALYRANLER